MKRLSVILCVVVSLCVWSSSALAQWGSAIKKLGKAAAEADSNSNKKSKSGSSSTSSSSGSTSKTSSADAAKPSDSTKSSDSPASGNDAAAKPAANSGAAASGATDTNGQPVLTSVKIDFVPGEKTVFYDDFSDMAPDEPPPHWKWRGDGPVNLMMGNGVRELSIDKGGHLISGKVTLPENFTVELTGVVYKGSGNPQIQFLTEPNDTNAHSSFAFSFRGASELEAGVNVEKEGELGSGKTTITPGQPFKLALWVQNGRIRAYVNGDRIVDANQVKFPPTNGIRIAASFYGGAGPLGIRSIRIAESTPDASTMLASTGKYVTHGIFFDTNSDKLKPESAPVIKQIVAALVKNPALKLEVDGFTDSTGDAARNLDLSKRRAQAVKTVLVSQFGIEDARLSSNGFGPDKPIASNDTPDGRAQNRRVEFVKK